MGLTVSTLLKAFEDLNVADDACVFSKYGGAIDFGDITERACVALKEIEVETFDVSLEVRDKKVSPTKQKIIVILLADYNFEYYKCLTVGDLKKFLENIENKREFVCIAKPEKMYSKNNHYYNALSVSLDTEGTKGKDLKLRLIFNNDIVHLNY